MMDNKLHASTSPSSTSSSIPFFFLSLSSSPFTHYPLLHSVEKEKKMATLSLSHFTPTSFIYFLLLCSSTPILSVDIATLLSPYPDLSDFTNLISTSSVNADLLRRSALTLLAVPNSYLRSSDLTHRSTPTSLADILRYHVLLEYLSWPELRQIPAAGKLITTLFQTTGRATNNFGFVNITRNPSNGAVSVQAPIPYAPSNATILSLVKTLPYNVTIFTVNSLIVPYGLDLMASDFRPPLGLNITKVLIDAHNFNVAASMLIASGVVEEFEADERGAGITLFVPTDEAYADLPATQRLQSLPADKKAAILKFHVLHSYYPLGSLQSIVNPVQPTLATEEMGAGSYTLNISRFNGSLAIDTGLVQASVTQTVFDQNPVSIFGVSKVLLPREIFGKNNVVTNKPGNGELGTTAPPPDISLAPENSQEFSGPPSHLSSAPGFREEIRSIAAINDIRSFIFTLFCTGLYLVV